MVFRAIEFYRLDLALLSLGGQYLRVCTTILYL